MGLGACVRRNENRTPVTEVVQSTFVLDSVAKSTQEKQHTRPSSPPPKNQDCHHRTDYMYKLQSHTLNADVL